MAHFLFEVIGHPFELFVVEIFDTERAFHTAKIRKSNIRRRGLQ
jgi:hypothetical protein